LLHHLKYFVKHKYLKCGVSDFFSGNYFDCRPLGFDIVELLCFYCAGDKIEKNEMGGTCSAYGGEACTGYWWGNLRERDHWGDPGVDGRVMLRWIFRKWDLGLWTELSWLRIETGGGHL
jgi:hypothetical protein